MFGPGASSDAELIAALQETNIALRKANSGLREVINTQAVQIETLTGQIEALTARADRRVATAAGCGLDDLLETALPQTRTSPLAHRLGPQAR